MTFVRKRDTLKIMEATIFDIQRFSLHDGSGLRTTVFFKGCPLSCLWCANPEGQKREPQIMKDDQRCMDCGDCSACSGIESARRICPTGALQVTGRRVNSGDLLQELLKDEVFFRSSGGGVCFSGGEPLTQALFCAELGAMLKEKEIPLSLESCLHVSWTFIEKVIPVVDEFFCDLKHSDPLLFREQTGGDLSLILENLRNLDAAGVPVRIRIPVIYGFNHSEESIRSILKLLSPLKNIKGVDLMPYHPLGAGKHRSLNMPYNLPLSAMPPEELYAYREMAEGLDHNVTIGGLI